MTCAMRRALSLEACFREDMHTVYVYTLLLCFLQDMPQVHQDFALHLG